MQKIPWDQIRVIAFLAQLFGFPNGGREEIIKAGVVSPSIACQNAVRRLIVRSVGKANQ